MIQIFFVHQHIYIWTPTPITLPSSRCACGVTTYQIAICTCFRIFQCSHRFCTGSGGYSSGPYGHDLVNDTGKICLVFSPPSKLLFVIVLGFRRRTTFNHIGCIKIVICKWHRYNNTDKILERERSAGES